MARKKVELALIVRRIGTRWCGMAYRGEQSLYTPAPAATWQELFVECHNAGFPVARVADVVTGEGYSNA